MNQRILLWLKILGITPVNCHKFKHKLRKEIKLYCTTISWFLQRCSSRFNSRLRSGCTGNFSTSHSCVFVGSFLVEAFNFYSDKNRKKVYRSLQNDATSTRLDCRAGIDKVMLNATLRNCGQILYFYQIRGYCFSLNVSNNLVHLTDQGLSKKR